VLVASAFGQGSGPINAVTFSHREGRDEPEKRAHWNCAAARFLGRVCKLPLRLAGAPAEDGRCAPNVRRRPEGRGPRFGPRPQNWISLGPSPASIRCDGKWISGYHFGLGRATSVCDRRQPTPTDTQCCWEAAYGGLLEVNEMRGARVATPNW